MIRPAGPIRASYWVVEGKLLAGEYPGAYSDDAARAKLSLFLDAGIRTFADLTEPSEPLRSDDDLLICGATARTGHVHPQRRTCSGNASAGGRPERNDYHRADAGGARTLASYPAAVARAAAHWAVAATTCRLWRLSHHRAC